MFKKILALVVLILILLSLLICILRPNRRNAISPDAGEISPVERQYHRAQGCAGAYGTV